MFDWALFLGLVGVSVPGIVVAVPQLLNTLEKTILNRLPDGKKMPPRPVLIIVTMIQSLFLISIAAAVGTARISCGTPSSLF